MTLLPTLRQFQPHAAAIMITGAPRVAGAIGALRGGAADFVPKPFTNAQLVERVTKALERQALAARQEKRFGKLRDAVRRLNESRRIISKKVDLLCNDLVSAYGELSRQLDGVRTQEGFRKYVEKAHDLEQLL
jgi:FixJ family two-component response regulator